MNEALRMRDDDMERICKVHLRIDTSNVRATMKAMVDKYKEDGSIMEVVKFLAQRTLPPNHPKRIFIEWLYDNIGHLGASIEALGLEVEEGPGFAARLEKAVMEHLQPGTVVIPVDELLDEPSEESNILHVVRTKYELVKQT